MAALTSGFRPGGRAPGRRPHVETAQRAIRLPRGGWSGDFAQMAVSGNR